MTKTFTKEKSITKWFRLVITTFLVLVGFENVWANKAIYLDPGVWNTDNPTYDVWAWKSGGNGVRYQSTKVGSYYQAIVPDNVTHVIWFRRSAAVSGTGWSETNMWNRSSGDASGFTSSSTGKNLLKITGWGSNGNSTWSTSYYDDITTYTVSGTGTTVKLSDSDKWISYTLYKDGTAVSNSSKTGTGSALSWTIKESGTYTIKGTNTYKTEEMSGSYTYNPCPAPDMPTATVEKHTTKCSGTDRKQGIITLTNHNPDYTYKLGDDEVSVSDDGKISGLAAGKYYITAVSSCGAETKTTSTFDVNATDVTPVATVKVTGDNEICSGETTILTATVTATLGTVSSYSWSPNDGTKDGNKYTTPALTKNASYLAQAKLTNDDCEKTVSATAYTITVKTAPEKPAVTLSPADGNIISGNKATLSVNSPVSGATYTLYEETKGKIDTGTSFEITEAGTYYVKGANDCGESPASESKTITVCTIGSTLNSAEYDAATQKVSLEGTFEFCGKESFHGFQWKKEGSDWCDENVPTDNSDYVTLGKTTEGGTKSGEYTIKDQNSAYVFRTYVVPVGGAWIYGNEITVTPLGTLTQTPNLSDLDKDISRDELSRVLAEDVQRKQWIYNAKELECRRKFIDNSKNYVVKTISTPVITDMVPNCPWPSRLLVGKKCADYWRDCVCCPYFIKKFKAQDGMNYVQCTGAECIADCDDFLLEKEERIRNSRKKRIAPFSDRLKETISSLDKSASGICPNCGCALREKIGKHGKFWGCYMHPSCKFAIWYDPAKGEYLYKND